MQVTTPTTAASAMQVTASLYDILRPELLAGGTESAHSLPVSSSRLQAAIDSILAEGIPSGVAEEAEVAMAITESRRLCSRNKALYTYVETMIKTTEELEAQIDQLARERPLSHAPASARRSVSQCLIDSLLGAKMELRAAGVAAHSQEKMALADLKQRLRWSAPLDGAELGWTLLHHACKESKEDVTMLYAVSELIDQLESIGVDLPAYINRFTEMSRPEGWSALHLLCASPSSPQSVRPSLIKMLVARGADASLTTRLGLGYIPLAMAAQCASLDMVRVLWAETKIGKEYRDRKGAGVIEHCQPGQNNAGLLWFLDQQGFKASDTYTPNRHMEACQAFMATLHAGNSVYLHCNGGMHRSPLGWSILAEGLTNAKGKGKQQEGGGSGGLSGPEFEII